MNTLLDLIQGKVSPRDAMLTINESEITMTPDERRLAFLKVLYVASSIDPRYLGYSKTFIEYCEWYPFSPCSLNWIETGIYNPKLV